MPKLSSASSQLHLKKIESLTPKEGEANLQGTVKAHDKSPMRESVSKRTRQVEMVTRLV